MWVNVQQKHKLQGAHHPSYRHAQLLQHLYTGGELGGGSEGVVHGGVSQVVSQVLHRALASHDGLHEEAQAREHGQAAVLDLLDLQLSEGVGIISQTQGVKGLTRVQGVQTLTSWAAVHTVTLNQTHQHHLDCQGGYNVLGVDQGRVAQVVQATILEDGSTSLEPDGGITELDAILISQQLGGDHAQSTQQGPAGVDQLQLTVALEGLGVSGQASGIPAVVTGELAGQVGGGVGAVGSQPLVAVGAIELVGAAGGLRDRLGALLGGLGLHGHLAQSRALVQQQGTHCCCRCLTCDWLTTN
mmetsp:Transcript_16163/g.43948  ORF Transcript_16163/g.43948 Transcript_16163/m.43948 type:complete len:300 (-) Transcript_16163:1-900(-)